MWQATENSDGQNSTCSQWNGDSSEGYKQVSRQGAMAVLSTGPWGGCTREFQPRCGADRASRQEVKPIFNGTG